MRQMNDFITKEDGLGFLARYWSDMLFSLTLLDYEQKLIAHVGLIEQPRESKDIVVLDGELPEEIRNKLFEFVSIEENWEKFKKDSQSFAMDLFK